ncbi:hypothetical protein STRCR_2026 [Streptococcus criceti HS-6]|uniref:Uncharacterized protein n=1 Tax=Streptococcus criceti HS-6 TaxID=873449 RepID=G5JRL7_STRCG|nr:hypothetical protein STRCR_2026 [Streptococcus criceti HS-6]
MIKCLESSGKLGSFLLDHFVFPVSLVLFISLIFRGICFRIKELKNE